MPTGYTSKILDGISFKEFALICAQCVTMRDDPSDKEIPESFEVSTWHKDKLEESKREWDKYKKMTIEMAENLAKEEYEQDKEERAKQIEKMNILRSKYAEMLGMVLSWKPPSDEHKNFKEFMGSQITKSIGFDCDAKYYKENPVLQLPGKEWLQNKIEGVANDIKYHEKKYQEEVERVAGRNLWIKQLRESLV